MIVLLLNVLTFIYIYISNTTKFYLKINLTVK